MQRQHWRWLDGWCIGLAVMLAIWAVSHLQMVTGSASLGLRYAVTLGTGYLVFLAGLLVLFGFGSLLLLYFGWEVLLAVAVEIAFGYVSARAAVRLAREGWLNGAVRPTWKPLLGALVCAVSPGVLIDHFVPQARSLPQVVQLLRRRASPATRQGNCLSCHIRRRPGQPYAPAGEPLCSVRTRLSPPTSGAVAAAGLFQAEQYAGTVITNSRSL